MKTLKMEDGDLVLDRNTGIVLETSGLEKAGQDVAEAILTEFNSYFQEGNEFLVNGIGYVGKLSEAIAAQYLTEAVNRLMIKSSVAGFDEKIINIAQLKTRIIGLTTIVFFMEVEYSDGRSVSVVDRFDVDPTKLDHLMNFNTVTTR